MNDFQSLCQTHLAIAPSTSLVWEAVVEIGDKLTIGKDAVGERFFIPITGGRFSGSMPGREIQGRVLPGGADRQLLRSDGIKELDALYELQTDDGAVITVHNRVTIDASSSESPNAERYALSNIKLTASNEAGGGKYAWLNRRAFVGTLNSLPAERKAVLVRVWMLR